MQDLANTAWAFAKSIQQDAKLCAAFSRVAELRLGDLKVLKAQKLLGAHVDAQILAMLIWSSAQLQMLSKCLANTLLKETRARIHEFSPGSLTSSAWAFDELGIQLDQRLKLMQKVGAAAHLLIEQFEPAVFLKFNWAFQQAGGKDDSWAKAAASQYERKYMFPSIISDVTLSMQVPVVKAVNNICDDVPV